MRKIVGLMLALVLVIGAIATGCAPAAPAAPSQSAASQAPAVSSSAAAPSASASSAAPAPAKKKYKIGFSVKTLTNEPFQAFIADGIKKKVEGLGHEFVLETTDTSTNVAMQVSQIEDLINMGCDGIVLNPMDSKAIVPVMKEAYDKGIKMIFVDTGPVEGLDDQYITYIGTDNKAASKIAGQEMVKALNNTGKVLLVRGADGNLVGNARADGFKEGLVGSGVQCVAEQTGKWTNDDAMQAMENMLQANPDVVGVFSCADVMLDGILQAIANNPNVKQDMAIFSVDGSMKGCQLIQAGKIIGSMAQYPGTMGEIAVEDLIAVLDGTKQQKDFPKFVDSGTKLVNKDNVAEAMKTAF